MRSNMAGGVSCYVPVGWKIQDMDHSSGFSAQRPDGQALIQCTAFAHGSDFGPVTFDDTIAWLSRAGYTEAFRDDSVPGQLSISGYNDTQIVYVVEKDTAAVQYTLRWWYPRAEKAAFDVPIETAEDLFLKANVGPR